LQSLRYRFAIALKLICNRCAIDLQSLRNRFQIASVNITFILTFRCVCVTRPPPAIGSIVQAADTNEEDGDGDGDGDGDDSTTSNYLQPQSELPTAKAQTQQKGRQFDLPSTIGNNRSVASDAERKREQILDGFIPNSQFLLNVAPKNNMRLGIHHFAMTLRSIWNCFAIAVQSLCSRYTNALHFFLKSLGSHLALNFQSL
jgi:hypothetical protein